MTGPMILAGSAASNTEVTTFWVLAVVAVAAALGMIVTRRAVHCAVLLAVVMLILAAMYAMQGAPFLAFVQVIVYTGAVLMLFLFVMMIVGITASDSIIETIRGQRLFAGPGRHRDARAADPGRRARDHRAGRGIRPAQQLAQRQRPGQAGLHDLRVSLRDHQRPADHGGARCHGARAPGADQPQAHAADAVHPPDRRRPTRPRCPALEPTRSTTRWTCPPCCRTARSRACRSAACWPARSTAGGRAIAAGPEPGGGAHAAREEQEEEQ